MGIIGKKSQVAVEFILMISLAMVVLIILVGVLYYLFYNYSEEKNINKLTDLGYSLQNEFILAAEVEPGYERNITFPENIDGTNYSIRISDNDVIIKYRDIEYLFAIPQVNGVISTKGEHTIRTTSANTIIIS